MNAILEKIKTEPAVVTGLVVAGLTLLVSFGVPLSEDQKNAIVGAVSAALALIGAFVVRSQVTPTADPKLDDGTALVPDTGYMPEHSEDTNPNTGPID